jgi:hypothetical protein
MTVGAFVGGECRGEGKVTDGRLFISVHGIQDEEVSFRLYDPEAQTYYWVLDSFEFDQSLGSYANPVKLHLGEIISGVNSNVKAVEGPVHIYDLNGREVENPSGGIYIINGSKTIIK